MLKAPVASFLNAEIVTDSAKVQTPYAFVGVPFGPPYIPQDLASCADAADAVRALTHRMEYQHTATHYDFDWGGPLFPDGVWTVTDCGDVIGDPRDPDAIWDRTTEILTPLVRQGRTPLVLGGLDSVPPMVVAAFRGYEQVNVLHIDAHLDFREEVGGVTHGYSSPIRRIREFDCVGRIVQVGLRAVGSGRPQDVADARAAGNELITAWQVHDQGIGVVLDKLRAPGRWVITVDCDGLDPSIAPGVGWPEPGGLTFPQVRGLIHALAEESRIAAVVFTEYQPARDIQHTTALTITRLLMNVMGLQRSVDPQAGR
ncbi:arginase family protein [Streptosporangium sp. CA-135522]|uniref:arginase family protein n=1 Tax=Streptosporangium sp. CA-135522 TaxID=3240072 RepID=UPI003D8C2B70